jgi:hypothetical protein
MKSPAPPTRVSAGKDDNLLLFPDFFPNDVSTAPGIPPEVLPLISPV